jgi:hypothetical protein
VEPLSFSRDQAFHLVVLGLPASNKASMLFRHTGKSRNPGIRRFWTPASAGVTGLCYFEEG